MALAEKRLSFESHVINFDRQEHLSGWYLRLNSNGVVPTLVHDERPIVDSSVICEYLDEVYEESIEQLRKCVERVAVALADGRAYLFGPSYSIADIVLAPSVVRMDDLGLHDLWDDLPSIAAWYERVQARPAFDVAYFPGSRITLAALEATAAS